MKVKIFVPCFVDQLYPHTAMSMVKILEHCGYECIYNPNQTCCGQPAYNAGFIGDCKDVAKKFIEDFSGNEYVVSPSGSCTGFLRNSLEEIFKGDEAMLNKIEQLKMRTFEITEFLINVVKKTNFGAALNAKVTYHDSCGALRECNIKQGPRQLLSEVKGLELIENKECETCCGFGGTFSVKFEPISIGMANTKIKSALETGAEYIVSTDVSCLMHIDGVIRKNNYPLKTIHIADLIANQL